MFDANIPHVGVYEVLDGLLSSEGIPPGSKGMIFSIIDELRAGAGPSELRRLAERISLSIHALEIALQCSDREAALNARGELKILAGECLQTRIFAAS